MNKMAYETDAEKQPKIDALGEVLHATLRFKNAVELAQRRYMATDRLLAEQDDALEKALEQLRRQIDQHFVGDSFAANRPGSKHALKMTAILPPDANDVTRAMAAKFVAAD
jgi:hypothetical protein